MSTLSLRLPDSLHRNLKQAADADGISINHFVSLAVAEKLSAIQAIDIIFERARGASRTAFLHAMSLVPRGETIDVTLRANHGKSGALDFAIISWLS